MKRVEIEAVKTITTIRKSTKRAAKTLADNGKAQPAVTKTETIQTANQQNSVTANSNAQPAKTPALAAGVQVRFSLFSPRAHRVSLCSEFNGWSPEAAPMQKAQDGRWQATVRLNPGRYQYKFVVDGEWTPDPEARENVYNQHGTLNSVIEVQA